MFGLKEDWAHCNVMGGGVVFGDVIYLKVFVSRNPVDHKLFCFNWSLTQWERMSMALDCLCLIVSLMNPIAVDLSTSIGVGGCLYHVYKEVDVGWGYW